MDTKQFIIELEARLPDVMQADAAWARHVLSAVHKRLKSGKQSDDLLQEVATRVESSAKEHARRVRTLPQPKYDEALPITAHRQEIISALAEHQVLVIAGETGSGKTTQLPKFCLEAGRGTRGLIGCTQPRRIAARAMAERVSEELGTRLGETVGYQVRFREAMKPGSLVKFMTDGILLAESRTDRALNAYDTLIIDEAHERSLNIDFLLGYVQQLLSKRPDLRVIITSATIDTQQFSAHFGDAPIIEVSGRGYPVDIVYQPIDEDKGQRSGSRDLYHGIAEAVQRVSRTDPRGDVLVFLSGEREIHEASAHLSRLQLRNTEVLPLYARLSAAEQHRVFRPQSQRRIILSTNVAETSLTVPRIRFVVDTGFARISRYAHRSRIQRLPIEPVSQASANQRAGRCGRLGPGICVRLYSEEDFQLRPEFTEPEVLRTSLATVILRMMSMGLGSIEEFPFIDRPAPRMINDAYALLFEIGALDDEKVLTPLGYRLARWPLDARLARMVIEGEKLNCVSEMIVLAAGLSIQDPRERPLEFQQQADEAHKEYHHPRSDFTALLKLWGALKQARKNTSGNRFRKWCRNQFLNGQRVLEWFDLVSQLRAQAKEESIPLNEQPGDYEATHKALMCGLLSNIGQRHPEKPVYSGVRNRQFSIFPGSGLFGRTPAWLMSAEVVETSKPYARTNAVIKPEWLEQQAPHLLKFHFADPHWSRRNGQVMAYMQISLYGLVLVERRLTGFGAHEPQKARQVFIREAIVTGDIEHKLGFVQHNNAIREGLQDIEAKRRRHDVLADDAVLAQVMDQRIPPDVNSVKSLRQWLAQIGDGEGDVLKLTTADFVHEDAGEAKPELYPDHIVVAQQKLPLSYRFHPGEHDDGVTLRVPLELLNQLNADQLDWLIPAYAQARAEALIKTLPKPQRRVLTPAANYAANVIEHKNEGSGSLRQTMSRVLSDASGLNLVPGDFDEREIEHYLCLRYEVVGNDGHAIAISRDLSELQQSHGGAARRRFMDHQGQDWNMDGAHEWVFDELPARCTAPNGARAYPALVDQQDAVGLRLFDTREEASWSHIEGIRRLIGITLADKLNWMVRNHGITVPVLASWSARGSSAALIRELAWSTLALHSDAQALNVRDAHSFDELVKDIRSRIGPSFTQRAALLAQILEALSALSSAVVGLGDRLPELREDLNSVLDDLLYEGFLSELEPAMLSHYPRFLQALNVRLEKARQNPAKDLELTTQLGDFWERYQTHLADGAEYTEALDDYRWLCHEYRVSVFAQNLGTARKTSPKRLEKTWAQVLTGA